MKKIVTAIAILTWVLFGVQVYFYLTDLNQRIAYEDRV